MPNPDLALLFLRPLNELGAKYVVSGSIASVIYGEPRLTHDVDIVIFLSADRVRELPKKFPAEEFYCPAPEVIAFEAAREQRGHINIIHHATGFKADLYFAGNDPLHAWAFRHSRSIEFQGERISVAPPEYVIIRKLEFFREGGSEKHLRDIRVMLKNSSELIDTAELERQINERGLSDQWKRVETT